MKRKAQLVIGGCAIVLGVELVLWLAIARDRLEGRAWIALLAASLEDSGPGALAPCVSVQPELYERSTPRDRARIAEMLEAHGVELLVAPPTHNPPTGYLDRTCVEIFRPPSEFEGLNLPVLAKPHVAYYTYDFNGDAVLMLQLGTKWVHVTHWNVWM